MCRVGDVEEKNLLFRAFIEQDEEFEYKNVVKLKVQKKIFIREL